MADTSKKNSEDYQKELKYTEKQLDELNQENKSILSEISKAEYEFSQNTRQLEELNYDLANKGSTFAKKMSEELQLDNRTFKSFLREQTDELQTDYRKKSNQLNEQYQKIQRERKEI